MPGLNFKLDRRVFLKAFSLSALASLWPGKAGSTVQFQNDERFPSHYIQNRDVPGFFIRSANPFPGVNMDEWSLKVKGLVENPQTYRYEDLFGFKMIAQTSRLKCVECWSAKAEWEGFHISELVDKVKPKPEAKYVAFQSADSYYESYTLDELLRDRMLLVLRMNGKTLSANHGFPLRLIAPFKYGYKNIKYITGIEFTDDRKRNYWADFGPYSVDGTIQPGIDHPLDYGKKPLSINGGEVFHFFDKRPDLKRKG
ncbi:molybdopterin-dependent oxidoreductase [Nitrospina watsonii]|uniref:Oxidored_molyb domain-containing protein n=1 Tax=Nitrospina watsonii TaxID=1323948 RepID=A0ABM9HGD3_9BACT|nr:molybdopterin-dependent oxidoreductase [Nitrospina watsonii]CAI2719296.1 Oxidored_molyb domain-containing protein [Nitrospina watsonii]